MPQVPPLETTQVFPAFARLMGSEQLLHLPNRAVAQGFRRQPHVDGVQVPFRFNSGAVDSEDHYRRAEDDDEDEDDYKSAERREGRLAPTPALRPGERTHRSSEDGLPVEIAAKLIGELVRRGYRLAGSFSRHLR